MKTIRKISAIMLTVLLMLAVCVPFASAETATGSITVSGAVKDATYKAYKIFDLVEYDKVSGAYLYKVSSAWKTFCSTGAGSTYVTLDANDYVTPKEAFNEDGAKAFAAAAFAYVKANTVAATSTVTASDSGAVFTGLSLGYYLVDTSVGSLCSLGTTDTDVTITEKNAAPVLEKKVKEDSDSAWHDGNDADIGQTVEFKATITAQAGAEKYVYHDKMGAGLTFASVSSVTLNSETVTQSGNYTVSTNPADNCTFDVTFSDTFCAGLKANDSIVILYSATLNTGATIGGDGNLNEAWLSYGDSGNTVHDYTRTYTWKTEVFKYTGSAKTALAGATFTVSKNSDGSSPLALKLVEGTTYRVAVTGDENTVTSITTGSTGTFFIAGLDADTYYLTETAHPNGYNGLSAPVTTVIGRTAQNDLYNLTGTVTVGENTVAKVEIENTTGTILPVTGGMGTVILVAVGCILFIGTAVILVSKKRLYNEGR